MSSRLNKTVGYCRDKTVLSLVNNTVRIFTLSSSRIILNIIAFSVLCNCLSVPGVQCTGCWVCRVTHTRCYYLNVKKLANPLPNHNDGLEHSHIISKFVGVNVKGKWPGGNVQEGEERLSGSNVYNHTQTRRTN